MTTVNQNHKPDVQNGKEFELLDNKLNTIILLEGVWATKGHSFESSFSLLFGMGFKLDQISKILNRTVRFLRTQRYCPICKKYYEIPFRTHYYLKHNKELIHV